MANFAENFLSAFVPGFSSGFQRADAKRAGQQQADIDAKQLRDRERLALFSTVGENIKSGVMTGEQGNRLLSALFPEFKQTRQVEERVSAPINQPPIEIPGFQAGVNIAPNVPLMGELPDKAKLPYTNMMTPVGIPTRPRGMVGQATVAPAEGFTQTKTVTEPAAFFQDKPAAAEKKTIDPVLTEAGQTIFKLYQEGKVPEAAVREFLPSYQEAIRTGDFSKLKMPTALTQTADSTDESKLKKIQLDLQNRGLDIQRKTLDIEQKKLDKATPFKLGGEGTDLTIKLQDRAVKQTEDYQTVADNFANMNAVLGRMRNNPKDINRIVADQAVINSFNKILDPKSVVREGEYKRTEDNQALLNKAGGWLAKIFRAGTTLTEADLTEIQETASAMTELRREIANKKLEKLRKLGQARGLDPEEFAPLLESSGGVGTPATAPQSTTTGPNKYKNYIQQNLK